LNTIGPNTTPRSGARSLAALLLGLLGLRLALLPLLPLLDPSEARYAGVARDMLARGDFVTPMLWTHFDYVPFFSKPPLAFWLQAFSFEAFGLSATAARLPAFLGSVAVVLLVWSLRRPGDEEQTLTGLLVLVSFPLFFICAGLGLIDIFLTIAVTGALWSHERFLRAEGEHERRRASLRTFFFLGLGMIAKGPVVLVFFGLPALLWCAWRRRPADLTGQAWWPGILIFGLPWIPWYLLAERAHPGFLEYFLLNENLLRYLSSDYGDRYGGGHRFPPGMAIVFFVLACLPWAVALAGRLRTPRARAEARRRLASLDLGFLAFAVAVDVLFLSLSRHLLGTYVLPLLPATAIIFSALLRALGMQTRAQARLATILVVVYSATFLAASPLLRRHLAADRVAKAALVVRDDEKLTGRMVFVGTWPYSAHFHAAPSCCQQVPVDAGNEHFEWYVAPENGHLIIIRDGDAERLDPWVRNRIRPVEIADDVGPYTIWLGKSPTDSPTDLPQR
jgi:4-amino-4-deoxy-L-arabinose transferase-like glycosyltransferase